MGAEEGDGDDVGEVVVSTCEAVNVLVLIVYFNGHEVRAFGGFEQSKPDWLVF